MSPFARDRLVVTFARSSLLLALVLAQPVAADPIPKRVVSMNVCTDQMAMLIAGEGQLYSVSYLAADENSSVLASQASQYAVNYGLAEEIFLMQPDLVIAGTYTTRATVSLLRRLGIRVEEFGPENNFDDIRSNLTRMGELLGQGERAKELVDQLDAALSKLQHQEAGDVSVAAYYANSYTSGAGTLVDAIIAASGLMNIAARLGLDGTARLPLELLVLAAPDIISGGGGNYSTPSLAQQNFVHPAYVALAQRSATVAVPAKYTICGAPFTAEAVRLFVEAGERVRQARQ